MVHLPRYVAFKSKLNDDYRKIGYLRYVNEDSEIKTYLQYSGEAVLSPYTKFEVEQAKCDPSLVNIRCCYNNKYWVSLSETNYTYPTVARAEKPEEDKSKWNCTLFQPVYDSSHQAFRFRHVFTRYFVALWQVGFVEGNCLRASFPYPDDCSLGDLNTVIDYEALVSIPKYVAFKGDNGCYLSSRWIEGHEYHQFSSSDIGDSRNRMETFITKDGNIRIKSNYFGKFWRRSPNWIWADSTDTTTDNPDTLFCPTKIDSNVIALRNLGNNNFIKRFTYEYKTSCLNAATDSIDAYSRLQMEEPVLEREIYNINFHPADSRIYDQTVLVMATENGTNRTEVPNTMNLNLSYIETESSTWSSSISVKLGVKTTIKTGIPRIFEGKVEVSSELSGSYQWGKTITKTQTIGTTYQVTVPPKTTVIVSLLATMGKCDVPYSYTQRDTLINGETKYYEMDDGVYHGVNSFNFTYEAKSKPAC